jgi:hypothetical protein
MVRGNNAFGEFVDIFRFRWVTWLEHIPAAHLTEFFFARCGAG